MATAADAERATRIEFGSVPDDSTGGAVPEENHELEARGISGFSQRGHGLCRGNDVTQGRKLAEIVVIL